MAHYGLLITCEGGQPFLCLTGTVNRYIFKVQISCDLWHCALYHQRESVLADGKSYRRIN